MCEDYKSSFRRLILLDFGGTLVSEEISDNYKKYHQTYFRDHPSPDVLNSLTTLCRDTQNTVFILSGKEQDWMEEAFSTVPGLGLVAEHGFYVCWPSSRVLPNQQVRPHCARPPSCTHNAHAHSVLLGAHHCLDCVCRARPNSRGRRRGRYSMSRGRT
jgi:trehalose-6-phosphatase